MADFALATRQKLRFSTPQGSLSVEDLWDLPLTTAREHQASLDALAVSLHHELQGVQGLSFVQPPDTGLFTRLQLQFDVVKHIIDIKLAERDAAEAQRAAAAKKQQLLALIEQKENEALSTHTLEELRAMVSNL